LASDHTKAGPGEQWGDGGYIYVEIDAEGSQRFLCD
jgi:hypothetical protein